MDHGDYFACYEPQVHLDEWAIVGEANPYQAPECRVMQLTGKVYNHPRFSDGEVVTIIRYHSKSVCFSTLLAAEEFAMNCGDYKDLVVWSLTNPVFSSIMYS